MNQKWKWDESPSFGWEAKQLQECDSAASVAHLLRLQQAASSSKAKKGSIREALASFPLHHPVCGQVRRRQSAAAASLLLKGASYVGAKL